MRRTLAAITATTTVMFVPGVTGTADAAAQERPTTINPSGGYISAFATHGMDPDGALKELIALCSRPSATVHISGQVAASIDTRIISIVTIPLPTLLAPGAAYLLASTRFTGAIPAQLFETETDTPDSVGIGLL